MSKNNSSGCGCPGCAVVFLPGLVSLGVGTYHGYMDAQGIPHSKENLEWWLTYGPAAVQGGAGAVIGGFLGLAAGVQRLGSLGAIAVCTPVGTAIGAGVGGIKGGLETLVGYGIGYMVGSLAKS
ncbi:MAG: hypothetical protein AABW48_02315 [Nanoarchaeota archaeon]